MLVSLLLINQLGIILVILRDPSARLHEMSALSIMLSCVIRYQYTVPHKQRYVIVSLLRSSTCISLARAYCFKALTTDRPADQWQSNRVL